MSPDELDTLSDATSSMRATRLLQSIRRSRRSGKADDQVESLVEWLVEQLIASRRGAQHASDAISPDHHPVETDFARENHLYVVFRNYFHQPDPEKMAEWLDKQVLALQHFGSGGWEALSDDEKSAFDDAVVPLLRRLRQRGRQEFVSRDFQASV